MGIKNYNSEVVMKEIQKLVDNNDKSIFNYGV